MEQEPFQQAVANVLALAGFSGNFHLYPLAGGGNNRGFRVDIEDHLVFVKAYFQHTDDPRDRLGTEYAFSRFAWQQGLRCLPQPLAADPLNGVGLYEFIQGHRLLPHEVDSDAVQQALRFYETLNAYKETPEAQRLNPASEACFNIKDHVYTVEGRLQRLSTIEDASPVHRQVRDFIQGEVLETWNRVRESLFRRMKLLGIYWSSDIALHDRCISPSDFGFHNAMIQDDGRVCFFDFEYAGWDDPAKMVCDFFCQPALPVSLAYYDEMVDQVTSNLSDPEEHLARITLLFPVYQIKWCCILLNDFLPTDSQRRRFAGKYDLDTQHIQLQKAQDALRQVS
ncbi:phosphotransferase [candidate division KSB3 bacterium]|uniref:Phosphotransferase n=1 Tax=candidate division KSB3 bacterium TaxID=2044937 RepID=A0A9D5Q5Z8_9BACT|nr:phosphotransferase [candidate division KSB3 bacterium]MBD3324883.1 phosphotransferase [candidate division KSB3 bacterium]